MKIRDLTAFESICLNHVINSRGILTSLPLVIYGYVAFMIFDIV